MERNIMLEVKRQPKGRTDTLRLQVHHLENEIELPLLHDPKLDETGIVKHCFTTRLGGASEGMFSSLNLSFTRGDDADCVKENFRRVAEAMEIEETRIVCSDQTHTTNVRIVTEEDAGKGLESLKDYTDVDGMVTNVPGLTLAAFFADCVPLYFVDPVHRAIGLSHSGWRGTVGRMGAHTLQVMKETFHTEPADVICAVGPSICQTCYEVSEDVAEQFAAEFPNHEDEILINKGNGKYLLDLWKANEIVLLEAQVRPEHLSVTDICTCCNQKLLFSHRASHGRRGNLGAFLCLK